MILWLHFISPRCALQCYQRAHAKITGILEYITKPIFKHFKPPHKLCISIPLYYQTQEGLFLQTGCSFCTIKGIIFFFRLTWSQFGKNPTQRQNTCLLYGWPGFESQSAHQVNDHTASKVRFSWVHRDKTAGTNVVDLMFFGQATQHRKIHLTLEADKTWSAVVCPMGLQTRKWTQ